VELVIKVLLLVGGLLPLAAMLVALFAAAWLRTPSAPPSAAPADERR